MPTIKDIARLAGVSYGTVSNVINGRGNVSVNKIKSVEEAIQKLGYKVNLQARILKEGCAKSISVILPNITSEQYSHLYDGLFSQLNKLGYETALYLTHDIQELELQYIQKIAMKRDSAVIVVSCLESAKAYYQTIKIPKNRIIFVYRKPDLFENFITLDFEQSGREIADIIMSKNYHSIGIFTNSDKNQHSKMLKTGLFEQFSKDNYPVQFHFAESAPAESTYNSAFELFKDENHPIDVIITSDLERANYIKNASFFGSLTPCPTLITLSNYSCFDLDNIYHYKMNYGMLSQQIVALIDGRPLNDVINAGFLLSKNQLIKSKSNQCLNLLILPSPSTQALKKLLPHFKKMTGIDVNLVIKPFDEIYTILSELDQHHEFDIIRIDMASLPWFAHNSLKPLNKLNLDIDELLSHYSPQVVERFSYLKDIVYAIPFDPSIQMLFYRRDLFNDPLVKRCYFEKYRCHLELPTDFESFSQITAFFNEYRDPQWSVEQGSCVTLGNSEIIASEFLLRYYANGGKLINQHRLELDKVIAEQTLCEFEKFISCAEQLNSSWWQESVDKFEQGKLAMLIVYTNLFSYGSLKKILPLIGYTKVPGNSPLFGGGSLAMSKYSKKDKLVATFFNWLFSNPITEQLALLCGSTVRDDVFQNHKVISYHPWLNEVNDSYQHGIRENQFQNGQTINLRRVEMIIGQQISDWVNNKFVHHRTIEKINEELAKQLVDLVC